MTEGEREALWNKRLTAKFNVCYYRCLVRRTSLTDRLVRAAISISSSGTVAVLLFKAGTPWPETLAVLTACLTVTHSIVLDPVKRLDRYSTLYGRWVQVARKYHDLWTLVQSTWLTMTKAADDSIRQQISEIGSLEEEVNKGEADVPEIEPMKKKCVASVRKQEGLG